MKKYEKVLRNIGLRAAELRHRLHLTQDQLATQSGVTGGYIRQIEGGWKDLRITTLCKIAAMLNCQPADLFVPAKLKRARPGRPRGAKAKRKAA